MSLVNITPVMTSNTTPSPYVVSASSVSTDTSYAPWKAFNGTIIDSTDAWASAVNTTSGYLIFNFGSKVTINAISLYSRYNTASPDTQMVKSFILYGSNDGISYDYILEKNNEILWNQSEGRLYKLDIGVCYQYYKIMIISINSSITMVIGDIKFWQDNGISIPITNTQASMEYCLGQNSTLAMLNKQNDHREGLLGFANDGVNYGTLWIVDNKGRATIPMSRMADSDILFDGYASTINGVYTLSKSYKSYKYLVILGGTSSGKGLMHPCIIPVKVIDNAMNAQFALSLFALSGYYYYLTYYFNTETSFTICDIILGSWTNLGISKIIGIK